MKLSKLLVVASLALFANVGCMKPFDRPEYVEVDTTQTAFVVPMEGDTTNQAQTQTVEFYQKNLINLKRIQIVHRWSPTGRLPNAGEWIPLVRCIRVDHQPVTRHWTAGSATGTSAKDQAIRVESLDSVGFSMGFECTAKIKQDKASTFLHFYPAEEVKGNSVISVERMMDSELRTKIQQIVSREAGKYELEVVRAKKNEIMDIIEKEVVPFFGDRGVEITALSILGGFTYDNPAIQKSIDDAVKESQAKIANEQRRQAQDVENKRMLSEAEGRATAIKRAAEGEAQATLIRASAEATAIKSVADAKEYELNKAKADPQTYTFLKSLEVEIKKLDKWKGDVPQWIMGGDSGKSGFIVQPPAPPQPHKVDKVDKGDK